MGWSYLFHWIPLRGAAMRITNAIFEACLKCKYKAWKLLQGEQGVPHAYEEAMDKLREEHKAAATTALLEKARLSYTPSFAQLTEPLLGEGHPLILNTVIEHGQFSVHCDALQRKEGKSALGNTLYEPVLFHAPDRIRKEQKMCLAFAGHALSKVQSIHPTRGRIVYPLMFSALQPYLPIQKSPKRRRPWKKKQTVASLIDAVIDSIDSDSSG